MAKFTAESLPDLTDRVAIVTGGNTGIGRPTIQALAAKGARVYMAARNEARAEEAIAAIKKAVPQADVLFLKMDLGDLESVLKAAGKFMAREKQLHILVNNAGIMATPYSETSSGFEIQWATNYLGHYYLTSLLLPTMLSTVPNVPPGTVRIVNVTSNGHELMGHKDGIAFDNINLKDKPTWTRYGQSKLGNILHVKGLKKRYGDRGILVAAVHPGMIATELKRGAISNSFLFKPLEWIPSFIFTLLLTSAAGGSLTSLYCAASPEFKTEDSGNYWTPVAQKSKPNAHAEDEALADRLWEWTEEALERVAPKVKNVDQV